MQLCALISLWVGLIVTERSMCWSNNDGGFLGCSETAHRNYMNQNNRMDKNVGTLSIAALLFAGSFIFMLLLTLVAHCLYIYFGRRPIGSAEGSNYESSHTSEVDWKEYGSAVPEAELCDDAQTTQRNSDMTKASSEQQLINGKSPTKPHFGYENRAFEAAVHQ